MKRLAKLMVWVGVSIAVLAVGFNKSERLLYPIRYPDEVVHASQSYNVPRNLILAVMRQESGFNPTSTSRVQAQGLMQLLPTTSLWIAQTRALPAAQFDPHKPSDNIDYGTWYLAYLTKQLNDDTLALEAYNAGITNVTKWEHVQPGHIGFAETDQFVKRVKQSKLMYDQLYGEAWQRQ